MRFALLAALSMLSCGHEPALRQQSVRVPPRLKSCEGPGPMVPDTPPNEGASVYVKYRVARTGRVEDVLQQDGASAALFRAVRDWLRTCRYRPATIAGKAVDAWDEQTFRFGTPP